MVARHWVGRLAQPALFVAVVVGFVLLSTVVLVRGRVLDAGLYTDALVRSNAYERTYTEVFADPEFADLVEQLLGGLDVQGIEPVQKRALATSALRLVVPPSMLQSGTETVVAALLAYVRGDVARLDADVDVSEVLDRLVDGAEVWVRARLASVGEQVTTSIEDYRTAVAAFVERVRAGVVPDTVPVLAGATVDGRTIADVLVAIAGPAGQAQRDRIEAAALTADQRDALIEATSAVVRARMAETVAELRSDLVDSRELDLVAQVAGKAHRSRAAVIDRLDAVRDAARWFGPRMAVLGAGLMVGAGFGLGWLNRRRPRRAALVLSAAAVASGCAVLLLWILVTRLVAAPLAPATSAGAGSWGLPAGLRGVLADVQGSLADDLAHSVRRLALVPIGAGLALAACVAVGSRLRMPASSSVAAGAAVALATSVVVWVLPAPAAHDDVRACNGAEELCGRAYDEVAYAATHNSMSSPDVVSVWPEHDGDIEAQLDAGIRALLIDTHHWTPLVSADQFTTDDLPLPPALANQIFDSLGSRSAPREGTYLCHNQCALGAIPFVDALVTVREFLEDNPDDVVTLIIQDAISPAETADAFAAAELDPYLDHHEPGTPWRTLDEMIDANERLVVFAESEGPPPDWYHRAFELIQDTPFRFETPEDFSCAPNRGDADATLFLMNHWITRLTPDRATAAVVNQYDVILDRARLCEAQRGRRPNFVAVDFFGIGDVIPAVATLNDLG